MKKSDGGRSTLHHLSLRDFHRFAQKFCIEPDHLLHPVCEKPDVHQTVVLHLCCSSVSSRTVSAVPGSASSCTFTILAWRLQRKNSRSFWLSVSPTAAKSRRNGKHCFSGWHPAWLYIIRTGCSSADRVRKTGHPGRTPCRCGNENWRSCKVSHEPDRQNQGAGLHERIRSFPGHENGRNTLRLQYGTAANQAL